MFFDFVKNFFTSSKKESTEKTSLSLPVIETVFFSEEDLAKILKEHSIWLKSNGSFGKRASFNGMTIPSINLFMADLKKADFQGSDLTKSQLQWADLSGADFTGANLQDVDFFQSNLKKVSFRNANLVRANLMSVEASETDFRDANLSMADLRSARCDNAIFFRTDLKDAGYFCGNYRLQNAPCPIVNKYRINSVNCYFKR